MELGQLLAVVESAGLEQLGSRGHVDFFQHRVAIAHAHGHDSHSLVDVKLLELGSAIKGRHGNALHRLGQRVACARIGLRIGQQQRVGNVIEHAVDSFVALVAGSHLEARELEATAKCSLAHSRDLLAQSHLLELRVVECRGAYRGQRVRRDKGARESCLVESPIKNYLNRLREVDSIEHVVAHEGRLPNLGEAIGENDLLQKRALVESAVSHALECARHDHTLERGALVECIVGYCPGFGTVDIDNRHPVHVQVL